MTTELNQRRMKALTGAFDRAIQTMIANANAAGWSADEALAAIDIVVAQLKISNARDPDPADDPEIELEATSPSPSVSDAQSGLHEDPRERPDEDDRRRLAEERSGASPLPAAMGDTSPHLDMRSRTQA